MNYWTDHGQRHDIQAVPGESPLLEALHTDRHQSSHLQSVYPRQKSPSDAILTCNPSADAYFYALIIPVLPFALHDRVQIPEDDVQRWIGFLLGAYGAGLLIGSRKFSSLLDNAPRRFTVDAIKQSLDGLPIVVIPVEALTFGA